MTALFLIIQDSRQRSETLNLLRASCTPPLGGGSARLDSRLSLTRSGHKTIPLLKVRLMEAGPRAEQGWISEQPEDFTSFIYFDQIGAMCLDARHEEDAERGVA